MASLASKCGHRNALCGSFCESRPRSYYCTWTISTHDPPRFCQGLSVPHHTRSDAGRDLLVMLCKCVLPCNCLTVELRAWDYRWISLWCASPDQTPQPLCSGSVQGQGSVHKSMMASLCGSACTKHCSLRNIWSAFRPGVSTTKSQFGFANVGELFRRFEVHRSASVVSKMQQMNTESDGCENIGGHGGSLSDAELMNQLLFVNTHRQNKNHE